MREIIQSSCYFFRSCFALDGETIANIGLRAVIKLDQERVIIAGRTTFETYEMKCAHPRGARLITALAILTAFPSSPDSESTRFATRLQAFFSVGVFAAFVCERASFEVQGMSCLLCYG